MKTARFLLLMIIAAALLRGTGFARQSNSAPQPTPSQSRETSARDSSAGQKDGQAGSEKNQTGAGDSAVGKNNPGRESRHVSRRRPKQANAAPSHQVHSARTPVAGSPRTAMFESGMGFHPMGSTTSSGGPNKTVNHRNAAVPPATGGLNGQQFKSSRDPGARLASSGGPRTATGGAAVINGTGMKRKP